MSEKEDEFKLVLPGRYVSVDDDFADGNLTAEEMAQIEAFVAKCEASKKNKPDKNLRYSEL